MLEEASDLSFDRLRMMMTIITQLSSKSLIVGSKFLQISFTYAKNRSGPSTLPYGTLDVTMTSSDYCLPTLSANDLKIIP